VRFEPRRIVFPEEEAAAATAKTHRTSPRLAGYYAEREAKEAQRKAIFKLIDETLAFSAAHKKAIEAPAPAEKVVFQVTYDPRTKKHVTFLWGL
jgi:phosphopantetheinyl transferase (holo-ACP synthase)